VRASARRPPSCSATWTALAPGPATYWRCGRYRAARGASPSSCRCPSSTCRRRSTSKVGRARGLRRGRRDTLKVSNTYNDQISGQRQPSMTGRALLMSVKAPTVGPAEADAGCCRGATRSWVFAAVGAVLLSQLGQCDWHRAAACPRLQPSRGRAQRPASQACVQPDHGSVCRWSRCKLCRVAATGMLYCSRYCTAIGDVATVLDPTVLERKPIVHTVILLRGYPAIQESVASISGRQQLLGNLGCSQPGAVNLKPARWLRRLCVNMAHDAAVAVHQHMSFRWNHLPCRSLAAGANADRVHAGACCGAPGAASTADEHPGGQVETLRSSVRRGWVRNSPLHEQFV
jgi:hypothetical protein